MTWHNQWVEKPLFPTRFLNGYWPGVLLWVMRYFTCSIPWSRAQFGCRIISWLWWSPGGSCSSLAQPLHLSRLPFITGSITQLLVAQEAAAGLRERVCMVYVNIKPKGSGESRDSTRTRRECPGEAELGCSWWSSITGLVTVSRAGCSSSWLSQAGGAGSLQIPKDCMWSYWEGFPPIHTLHQISLFHCWNLLLCCTC